MIPIKQFLSCTFILMILFSFSEAKAVASEIDHSIFSDTIPVSYPEVNQIVVPHQNATAIPDFAYDYCAHGHNCCSSGCLCCPHLSRKERRKAPRHERRKYRKARRMYKRNRRRAKRN